MKLLYNFLIGSFTVLTLTGIGFFVGSCNALYIAQLDLDMPQTSDSVFEVLDTVHRASVYLTISFGTLVFAMICGLSCWLLHKKIRGRVEA